jgi:IS5 family transposase
VNLAVTWTDLFVLIEHHAPSEKTGRAPFAVATMLRMHFLQQGFGQSELGMEEALQEIQRRCEFDNLEPCMG